MAGRMKVLLSLLLSMVFVSSTDIAKGATMIQELNDDNFIPNPGIELIIDGRPDYWVGFTSPGQLSTDARTGRYALLMDADQAMALDPGADRVSVGWQMPTRVFRDYVAHLVEPGQTYTLSYYYKTEGDPKFRQGMERRRWIDPNDKEKGVATHNQYLFPEPAEDWTYMEMDFEWPHPETHDMEFGININFMARQTTGGKLWVDDVCLVEKLSTSRPESSESTASNDTPNLVANSYFEDLSEVNHPSFWSVVSRPFTLHIEEDALRGRPAAKLSGNGEGFALLVQRAIPVSEYAGEVMDLSAWYKGNIRGKLQSPRNFIRVEFYKSAPDGGLTSTGGSKSFHAPGDVDDWIQMKQSFQIYEGTEQLWVTIGLYNVVGDVQWAGIEIMERKRQSEETRDAGVFYVAPDGSDANDGSRKLPWATVGHASSQAVAGDTILFYPGNYVGVLRPVASGTAEEPIIFQALERRTARLVGDGGGGRAIDLSQVEHVHVKGFHVQPSSEEGRWLFVSQSKHIQIEDVLMEGAGGGLPMQITNSEHVFVRDSVMRHGGFNMARVGDSKYIVFEGNSITRAGHSPLQFYPDNSTRYVIIRGNVFHALWGRNFEFFGSRDIVFEHNIITNGVHSSRSASANAKFATHNGIFRFNRIMRNWGGPLHLYPMRDVWLRHIKFYHNVFDDNYDYGIALSNAHSSMEETDQMVDIEFVNNVFYRNDHPGQQRQIRFSNMGLSQLDSEGHTIPRARFISNFMASIDPKNRPVVGLGNQYFNVEALDDVSELVLEKHTTLFLNNVEGIPNFVDAVHYDHVPAADSPLLAKGRHLTYTLGAGEGRVVPVRDASYFYDGFGIEGERGDVIAIGTPDQRARIVHVDRDHHQLTLSMDVRWDDGDPVSFPWSGNGPDIGAYETGTGGRPNVSVTARPFQAVVGEEVQLSLSVFGLNESPKEIRWQLGDGTIAYGDRVHHRYNEPYDYPIRVKVTLDSGETLRGTGYVVITSDRVSSDPLIYTTFDEDDEDWSWQWKLNSGTVPIDWSHELDTETGEGYLKVTNPGGGSMPFRIAPMNWDVSTHPWVYVRYRITPGTPVGMYVTAFLDEHGQTRKKWLAAPRSEQLKRANETIPYRIMDDGEWHVLLIDARRLLDDYSEAHIAQYLGMETMSRGSEGDTFWIDEIAVLPDEATGCCLWRKKLVNRQRGHLVPLFPRAGEEVRDGLAVDFRVVTYDTVAGDGSPLFGDVDRIEIAVDGVPQLFGRRIEDIKDQRIDTNTLDDGEHTMTIFVRDHLGRELSESIPFVVRNWERMTDPSKAPREVMLFGDSISIDQDRTSERSSGWVYVEHTDNSLVDAPSGRIKQSDEMEYLAWEVPGLRHYEVVLYTDRSELSDVIAFEADIGLDQWISLPFDIQAEEKLKGGIVRYVLKGSGPTAGQARSFRLTVGARVPSGRLQLDKVVLDVRSDPSSDAR